MTKTSTTSSRRWTLAAASAAMVAVAGAALAWHGHAHAFGPGFGHHRHGGWEQADPETISRKIEAMVSYRLAEVDATPEQKSRITAIMKGAANDLASVRGQARELRRKSMELLAAPAIDRAQIEQVLAERHDLLVISDEIWADLVFSGSRHIPFASLSGAAEARTVTATAASKTFNVPGLQPALTVIPNPRLRRDFAHTVRACGIPEPNAFCLEAVTAAYAHGDSWLEELLVYLEGNRDFLCRFVEAEIPQVRVVRPDATFLAWLDCRALGLEASQLEHLLLSKARLVLNQGYTFGPGGEGFVRMNLGCPRRMLEDGLERLATAVRSA